MVIICVCGRDPGGDKLGGLDYVGPLLDFDTPLRAHSLSWLDKLFGYEIVSMMWLTIVT